MFDLNSNDLISIQLEKIIQTHAYTALILAAPMKKFAIYTEPQSGKALQGYLTEASPQRPMSHHFVGMILRGMEAQVLKVIIHKYIEGVFYTKVMIASGCSSSALPRSILEIDARPSDSLSIAVLNRAPVYCTPQLLDTIPSYEESSVLPPF